MLRIITLSIATVTLSLLTSAASCQEPPKPTLTISLDPTFGKGGMIAEHSLPAAPKHDRFLALAIDGRGRPVAAGKSSGLRFALARYATDGRPDAAFADNGKASVTVEDQATVDAVGTSEVDSPYDMSIDAKGRVVVVGKAVAADSNRKTDFVVLRFDDSGRLDKTFSGLGHRKYPAHDWPNVANAVATAADGGILVAGYAQADERSRQIDPLLIRFRDDGAVDETFSAAANGSLRWLVKDAAPAAVSGVVLDQQGRCVVSLSIQHDRQSIWGVARLKNNGELDDSFGDAGLWSAALDEKAVSEVACSVAVDETGRIVAGGYSQDENDFRRLAIVRLTNAGKSDPTFGAQKNGVVVLADYGATVTHRFGPRLAVAQGKIAITGSLDAASGNSRVFGLAVLNDSGTQIAKAAPKAFPGSKGNDQPWGIAFDPQGRVLIAGTSQAPNGKWRFALARYIISPK